MELAGGAPYKYMLKEFFPALRRVEITVNYDLHRIMEQKLQRSLSEEEFQAVLEQGALQPRQRRSVSPTSRQLASPPSTLRNRLRLRLSSPPPRLLASLPSRLLLRSRLVFALPSWPVSRQRSRSGVAPPRRLIAPLSSRRRIVGSCTCLRFEDGPRRLGRCYRRVQADELHAQYRGRVLLREAVVFERYCFVFQLGL